MEKLQEEEEKRVLMTKSSYPSNLWDCGSTLYDYLKRQLDSAIANSPRTLSMPRLPVMSRKSFNISRSFQKLLRSVFKSNSKSSSASFQVAEKYSKERLYVVYHKSGPVREFEIAPLSPEIPSFVRRSASDRFTPTSIGISCA